MSASRWAPLGAAVATAAIGLPSAHAAPKPLSRKSRQVISAAAITRALQQGRPVVLASIKVRGRLDLRPLASVSVPFKCRGCDFTRGIEAADVVFGRTVDLSGAHIQGPVDLEGASFAGPVLFAAAPRRVLFASDVDAALAVFGDVTTFEQATFAARARFRLARFRSDATFASAQFTSQKPASFSAAAFDGNADFDRAVFDGGADFARSSFDATAFRGARFQGSADFRASVFRSGADFSQSMFMSGATFEVAQFLQRAAFVGAQFFGQAGRVAASFASGGAAGDVDFSFANFQAQGDVPEIADFSNFVAAGTLSFKDAEFPDDTTLQMNSLSAKSLVLQVDEARSVADGKDDPTKPHQRDVLRLIESSAKNIGDLPIANDADFQLHVLRSRTESHWYRWADVFFYRDIAGYLVRPLQPLLTLLALAFLLTFARMYWTRRKEKRITRRRTPAGPLHRRARRRLMPKRRHPRRPVHRTTIPRRFGQRLLRLWRLDVRFVNAYLDTLVLVAPGRRGRTSASERLERRIEVSVYRVLLVCVLIGLANSNPTLRQFVDAFT